MPNDSYEFSYMSTREKRKILIAKIIFGLVIASCLYWIATSTTDDLSADLMNMSAILTAVFGYINLINVKSELMELFEPPYSYNGSEFVFIGFALNIASWFV